MNAIPFARNLVSLSTLFLCLWAFLPVSAQNSKIRKGDKQYEHLVYPKAIESYEKGLSKSSDVGAMERLADAYVQVGNHKKAEEWYGKIAAMPGVAPINKLKYGQMLMANGKYDEARSQFQAYLESGENSSRAARMKAACDFAQAASKSPSRYTIKPEPHHTKGSEFGPIVTLDGYFFVAERVSGCVRRLNLRNNNGFYDMYEMRRDVNSGKGYKVKPLKGKVNRKYHDGPGSLTNDGNTLYFTRSYYVKDKKGKLPVHHSKLEILSAQRSGKKWKNLEEMPFASENYSCGHPALSPDGKTMVFASDIPGGFGGTDLYVSFKNEGGWTTPTNLGSGINSEGDEQFPNLQPNGMLYFASDGLPGFGGMDIFGAAPAGNKWGKAENLGWGLNTQFDDFSISWLPGKSVGFFASDREGDDNIYRFDRKMLIKGVLVDKRTGKPVPDADITLLDASNKESKLKTDAEGRFEGIGDWGKEYLVSASKAEYLQMRERITTSQLGPTDDFEGKFEIEPDLVLMVMGKVTDAETQQPIPGAKVRIISSKDKPYTTDNEGKYEVQVAEEKEYTVVVQHPGYIPQIFSLSTEGKTQSEDFKFDAALLKGNGVLVEGLAFANESREPIHGVHVRSVDLNKQEELANASSRKDGRFWMVLNPEADQFLIGSKTGYFASRAELPDLDPNQPDAVVKVELGMVPYEVGALVKIIYYDYNKSDIKRVARKELYEIVYFLRDNPEASVELSSYTDSRGGSSYNEKLSQQRSESAVGFMVGRGIARKRLAAKGYGETNLVNNCVDGVECTDEQHSANRRTEIRITKLD